MTEGDTVEEALSMAKDALEFHLYGMELDQDYIPTTSNPGEVAVDAGSFISLIETWMPPVRKEMMNRSVKKTLTIPKWLNDIAEEKGVNYSHILQAALKRYLGVQEPPFCK
ncbi:MAG: type II toxin-antitoxin system HicB family antitoxin [Eubacteriales bacterium]|nr:type II toxin-antitoxin system HicB family antitoxin [Eubacteriales bacterium]